MIDKADAQRAAQEVPNIPRDDDGPVFREPWEAQAFAMTLALHARGVQRLTMQNRPTTLITS